MVRVKVVGGTVPITTQSDQVGRFMGKRKEDFFSRNKLSTSSKKILFVFPRVLNAWYD